MKLCATNRPLLSRHLGDGTSGSDGVEAAFPRVQYNGRPSAIFQPSDAVDRSM